MGRQRGFWWAPDGESLLAARVDESGVQEWHIGDPSNPDRAPTAIRYPAAGTANAEVSLSVLHLDGRRIDVSWDREAFPYLVNVRWRRWSAPLLQLAARDQRTMRIVEVDVATGATTVLREDTDAHWLEVIPGVPDRLPDGRLVCTVDADDTRRLRGRRRDRHAARAAGAGDSRVESRGHPVQRVDRADRTAPVGLLQRRSVRAADVGRRSAQRHRGERRTRREQRFSVVRRCADGRALERS